MKNILSKIYIILSIVIVPIYLSLGFVITIRVPDFIFHIVALWLPTTLIVNAVIGVPIVIHKKLDDKAKKIIVNILKFLSFFLILFAMIWAYLPSNRGTEGWHLLFIWFGNAIFIFVVAIAKMSTMSYSKEERSLNNISPLYSFFYISLIIWSMFVMFAAIQAS